MRSYDRVFVRRGKKKTKCNCKSTLHLINVSPSFYRGIFYPPTSRTHNFSKVQVCFEQQLFFYRCKIRPGGPRVKGDDLEVLISLVGFIRLYSWRRSPLFLSLPLGLSNFHESLATDNGRHVPTQRSSPAEVHSAVESAISRTTRGAPPTGAPTYRLKQPVTQKGSRSEGFSTISTLFFLFFRFFSVGQHKTQNKIHPKRGSGGSYVDPTSVHITQG